MALKEAANYHYKKIKIYKYYNDTPYLPVLIDNKDKVLLSWLEGPSDPLEYINNPMDR